MLKLLGSWYFKLHCRGIYRDNSATLTGPHVGLKVTKYGHYKPYGIKIKNKM